MRSVLVLSLALAVLAGCLTSDPSEGAAVEAADAATGTEARATSAAGEGAAVSAAGSAGSANASVLQAFPVSFDGSTGTYVCHPTGPGSTSCALSLQDGGNTFDALVYEGVPASAELTLTWEPTSPVNQQMYVTLFAVRSCGDGCMEWDSEMFREMAEGPSPLALSVPAIALGEGESLYLSIGVREPNPSQYPVYFAYSMDQPFSVEGVLNALVPSAG